MDDYDNYNDEKLDNVEEYADYDLGDDNYETNDDSDDMNDEMFTDDKKDEYYNPSYYEALGMEDGRFDKDHNMLPQSGFGSSVNLDELDDDQREAYELGYGIGAEDYDLSDDE